MLDTLEVLIEEHKIILKAIDTLNLSIKITENGSIVPDKYYYNFIELIKVFADRCHHSKEETVLFPLIRQKESDESTSIATLNEEHEKGRQFIRGLEESLSNGDEAGKISNAKGYAQLLSSHIKHENGLFPVWIGALSETDRIFLFEKFKEIEQKIIGLGKHEEYILRVESLKSML